MKHIAYWIKSLFIFSILEIFCACADDLGNYDYQEIPEIQIEGIQPAIEALSFQNLSIPVTLKGLLKEERYTYEWKTIRQFQSEDKEESDTEILSTEKELNQTVTLRPGPYKLIYTVTDTVLDVYYQQMSNLNVVTTTSEGWVVLCSEDGNTRLDMISTLLGTEMHIKDMLADSDMPFKKGPRALLYFNPQGDFVPIFGEHMPPVVDPVSPFYIFTDEGATRLHRDAFEWKEEYNFKYEMGDSKDPKPYHIGCSGANRVVVSEDGIFDSDYSMTQGLWGSALNYFRNPDNSRQTIHVAPYVGCNIANPFMYGPSFMFYDLDHKQFVYYPGGQYPGFAGMTNGCLVMNDLEAGGNAFSFPTGYNYVYMENTKFAFTSSDYGFPNAITYTILENGGKYYLYGINLGDALEPIMMGSGYPYTKTHYADLSDCEGISEASHFAFSSLNNQMFYSVGKKVYRVDLYAEHPSAEFQFDVPGEITCLKFWLYFNPENEMRSYDLIVGSDRGGIDGGELRVYDARNGLEQVTECKESHTGFARIVDIVYREPLTQQ